MEGGNVTGCTATGYGYGGGVSNDNGIFTMNDGSITDCTAYNGGGLFNGANSTYSMSGGSITDCSAEYAGGGVCNDSATFTMEGGTICNCNAKDGGGAYNVGGGMFNGGEGGNGYFIMKGGTITDCFAGKGGGVIINEDSTFQLSGNPVITGNTQDSNPSNLCLLKENGKTITINGELTQNAVIGLTMKYSGVFTSGWGTKMGATTDPAGFFFSDNREYEVLKGEGGEASLKKRKPTLGDLNLDLEITMADVVLLNRYVLGKNTLTPEQLALADVNKDGDVTMADVVLLNRYVVGLIKRDRIRFCVNDSVRQYDNALIWPK